MIIGTYGLQGDFNIFNFSSSTNSHFVTIHQSPINGIITLISSGIIISYGEDGRIGATLITKKTNTYDLEQGLS
jgi:hypothetical protein